MRINHSCVSEGQVCIFALKFELRVVGTSISQRITIYEGNPNFQWKPSINIENF